MNTSISQTKNNDLQYGISHCKKTFNSSGEPVVNSYKCNQKQFSASDMWSIQKQRMQITIGQGIHVI
jgi:hypothetical protein